jgi:hypothetical protein
MSIPTASFYLSTFLLSALLIIIANCHFLSTVRFACERWLATNEDDHKIERELTSFEVIKTTSGEYKHCIFIWGIPNTFVLVIPYEITVFTGDKPDAGTDANVFLTLYGEHEDSGKD